MKSGLKKLFVLAAGAGAVCVAGGAALVYQAGQILKAVEADGHKDVGVSVYWGDGAQFVAKNPEGKPVSGTSDMFFVGTPKLEYDARFRSRLGGTPQQ